MKEAANFIGRAVVRATQRTVRFIRWLRGQIYSEAPLRVSAIRLAAVLGCEMADFFTPINLKIVPLKFEIKILNEVKGVNRVLYDISIKPPASIEWE